MLGHELDVGVSLHPKRLRIIRVISGSERHKKRSLSLHAEKKGIEVEIKVDRPGDLIVEIEAGMRFLDGKD